MRFLAATESMCDFGQITLGGPQRPVCKMGIIKHPYFTGCSEATSASVYEPLRFCVAYKVEYKYLWALGTEGLILVLPVGQLHIRWELEELLADFLKANRNLVLNVFLLCHDPSSCQKSKSTCHTFLGTESTSWTNLQPPATNFHNGYSLSIQKSAAQ